MTKNKKVDKYLRHLLYWRPVRTVLHTSRMVVIPGFQGVPLFDVMFFFIKGLMKGVLNQRAAAASFHFVLAIFPLMLFFFTLLPYLDTDYYAKQLFVFLKDSLPASIYPTIEHTLADILHRKHNGLMSIGFLSSIYVASNGINAILVSFNQTHHAIEKRKWLKRRLISIVMVFIIAVAVIVSFTLVGGFRTFMRYLETEGILDTATKMFFLKTAKWILLISVVYFSFAALYYFTPANRKSYNFFSAGASLATVLFILTTQGFNYYVIHFSRYNALYGSIGALIVFLLWTYINAFILLIGFELNASISEASSERKVYEGANAEERPLKINRTARTNSLARRWKRWKTRYMQRKSKDIG